MNRFGAVREHLLATVAVGLFAATLAAASAGGLVLWLVLAALGDGPIVGTLGTLLPGFLAGFVVGVPVAGVAALALVYGVAARTVAAAADGAERVGRGLRRLDRRTPPGIDLSGVAEAVDPRSPAARAEDRVDRAKARYVDGRLSEVELERRVRAALAEEGGDLDRVPTDAPREARADAEF